jgi:hypothetical protein
MVLQTQLKKKSKNQDLNAAWCSPELQCIPEQSSRRFMVVQKSPALKKAAFRGFGIWSKVPRQISHNENHELQINPELVQTVQLGEKDIKTVSSKGSKS